MSTKNKKQFGVWLDTHQATIVGREDTDTGDFAVIGSLDIGRKDGNSNENAANNAEQGNIQKMFKEITSHMQNVDEILVTGTGDAQEQFIKYLSDTPQYKSATATASTSIKMSDEKLIELIAAHYN